tara:strand:- start:190 stop:441 length:252 start_codon:yes stop_codon:yes gene_type:complete
MVFGLAGLFTACVRQGALPDPGIEPLTDGVFMVPVDRDATGCVRYRVISDRRLGDYTVYWRVEPGHFTDNRTQADCKPREARP